MTRTPLTRRLLASAAGLLIGTAGALTIAVPAHATDDDGPEATSMELTRYSLEVAGAAECDPESGLWTVTWTVENTSLFVPDRPGVVTALSAEVDGIALGDPVAPGEALTGTQTFEDGTPTAELTAELTWGPAQAPTVKEDPGSVELGECKEDEDPDPEEPPAIPATIAVFTCDLLVFIIDNTDGEGEATVTFTPTEPVTHGHASGFSYTVGEDGEIEVVVDDDAGIDEVVGEASSDDPVELGPFPAGADLHSHGFEASEDLVVTVELTVDGEPVELDEDEVSWAEGAAGLDCEQGEDGGEGGELPATGAPTTLIAGAAVTLLALGGGLFLLARRRVTFTA